MSATLEFILKRDRWAATFGLMLVIALAWGYLFAGAGMGMSALEMTRMASDKTMDMAHPTWTFGYALLMFVMWWIMMAAMMLPGAAPVILLATALNRKARVDHSPYGTSGFFVAGYLLVWAFFSLAATIAQWSLTEGGLLSSMMQSTSPHFAGGLLIAAGLWQLTPIKQACLRRCRSPVTFLTQHPRKGNAGSLAMGMEHGAYCLGCCGVLMALHFVGGVMNLHWIAGLAAYVLAEKLLPFGQQIGWATGFVLVLFGLALITGFV
ncbi:MAG: DUF2182 domain-containing protein [Burkholderiales bacterium]